MCTMHGAPIAQAHSRPLSRFLTPRVAVDRPLNESMVQVLLGVHYPPDLSPTADNGPQLANMLTDLFFHCSTRHLAQALTASGAPVHLYRFDQRAKADTTPVNWGVTHGSEVPFVFDNGSWVGDGTSDFTPQEEQLATLIGAMWSRFASGRPPLGDATPPTVEPGAGGVEDQEKNGDAWPPYAPSADGPQVVLADLARAGAPQGAVWSPGPFRKETSPRAAACDFWEAVGWR
mmetsp:Transcript_9655/g.25668  ORF Transcript_9655/g.25668 Transcript_9655/m.25668 type:complete len:232 (+) Transcript_9655:232-927(+)